MTGKRSANSHTSCGPKHCAAHRIKMAMIGAVVKLIGTLLKPRYGMKNGKEKGRMTQMMERMNTTRVAIEDPETIIRLKRLEHAAGTASYLVGYTRSDWETTLVP